MMSFEAILLLSVVSVGLVFYFVMLANAMWGDYDFTTNKRVARQVALVLKNLNLEKSTLYDLGSCRGAFALNISRACPQLKVFGVEKDPLRNWYAKFISLFSRGKAKFLNQDIFKVDLSSADVTYIYLERSLLPKLQKKLEQELKPGSVVVSQTVSFPSWQ